ncbi:bifunctional 3-deoxy-7-phosphoheptulonate synthase/chorismate mutase type II [Porphyromonadaceae bacterium OttesenSCG-928-L07]|nr:bifunctional 3-deoxy-7-phosphoheptulonate synthase/chorismate mutase type II [Porphyromonadaceae bacterium OttesenSCG-928-L07]MDL2252275.1 bifunctional 3-deoxy-7-phosphoheptulonate synthase/chorismate mutase type II [Odoribacter sp. OttesenSCG-928-J03]MDL2330769.1 bifunctional 3-deoxy-7-phosphoheptulonate synthase/chorismate mutase type II [Odoribacter sp. OttesenSCG-928-A06]
MGKDLKIDHMKDWGLYNVRKRPLLIAGPCSAESEEQVFGTAEKLKENGLEIFRAGVWKPRTRPNCYEGAGVEGLKWLKRVQEELGMKTAVEVANAKHVHEALKSGVDLLWIGARTTSNPFAVQEIAEALQGVDVPVLVKNPLNPDLNLWIGALERFYIAGVKRLGAIHRGFFSVHDSKYRNTPAWQLPIELKCRLRDITIFCDPSHISGKRAYLEEISQKAIDLGFDGLMIESHIHPEHALSDSEQQITPEALALLLLKLQVRDTTFSSDGMEDINKLRVEIDTIDDELLEILSRRMQISLEIGQYKKRNNITILQPDRWAKILQRVIDEGEGKGLPREFIETIFNAIHEESINQQTRN